MILIIVIRRKQLLIFALFIILSILTFSSIRHAAKINSSIQAGSGSKNPYKIYLTFDDGPSKNTEKALDILKSYKTKATFFVIGQTDEHEISLYKRIISEGHSLGLHSYTHNTSKIYASTANCIQDFERLRDWIYESTGSSTKICRMVGGSNSRLCPKNIRTKMLDYFNDNGYACYDWDIDPLDSSSYARAASSIAENIKKAAKGKPDQDLVVLLHDDKLRTTLPEALELIIPYFLEQGYAFDVLDSDTILNNSKALAK